MLCPKCAAENDDKAVACASCGESLQGAQPVATATAPQEPAATETVPEDYVEATPTRPVNILGWVVVLVALVPWIAFVLFARQDAEELGSKSSDMLLKIMNQRLISIGALVLLVLVWVQSSVSSTKRRLGVPALLVIMLAAAHIAYTLFPK